MNIWLKRVSLILPPVIVAGVYFDKIPVGPSIRKKFDSMMSETKIPPVKQAYPKVEKILGEVFVKDHASFTPVPVVGGEILKEGQSFATGPNSALLLSYRGPDSWLMRISSDAQINIDELMKMKDQQTTTVNLMQGGLILKVINKTGAARNIKIRTKVGSFSVNQGTLAVLTDGETRSLMTVQQGLVEAENYKLMEKTPVREAHTYFLNREGEKKVELDLDALDLYNWEPTDLASVFPVMEKVVVVVGDLGPTPDDKEKARIHLLKEVNASIQEFETENEKLQREHEILIENAEQSRLGLKEEKARVNKDIRCLETSSFECNLFSEKILLMRGFPRTWGNPQYRYSLVVGLGKYLQERNEEVINREEEEKILSKLMTSRKTILRSVRSDLAAGRNLEKLIRTLQDDRLRR
jgi:hypothetical protein